MIKFDTKVQEFLNTEIQEYIKTSFGYLTDEAEQVLEQLGWSLTQLMQGAKAKALDTAEVLNSIVEEFREFEMEEINYRIYWSDILEFYTKNQSECDDAYFELYGTDFVGDNVSDVVGRSVTAAEHTRAACTESEIQCAADDLMDYLTEAVESEYGSDWDE